MCSCFFRNARVRAAMRTIVPSLNARLACYQTSERKMHSRSSYAPVIWPYLRRLLLQMPKTSADVLHRVLAMFQASARGKHSRLLSAPIILSYFWPLQSRMLPFSKTGSDILRRVLAISLLSVQEGKAFAFLIRSYHLAMSSATAT